MSLLRRERVAPRYAQIQFGDALATDYPEWVTGEEAVIFTTQTIVVATREDRFGDVEVEVWKEQVGTEVGGTQILEIEIQLIGETAHFGSFVGGQLYEVPLSRGWHRVRVLVEPEGQRPSVVRFALRSLGPDGTPDIAE
jgi:hypothetical protein